MLPSGPKDGLNSFVLAILLTNRERLALVLIYLWLLYSRLDDCVSNIVRVFGRYNKVTHADTSFLQMFLLEHFQGPGLELVELPDVEMVEVVSNRLENKSPKTFIRLERGSGQT